MLLRRRLLSVGVRRLGAVPGRVLERVPEFLVYAAELALAPADGTVRWLDYPVMSAVSIRSFSSSCGLIGSGSGLRHILLSLLVREARPKVWT